MIMQLAQKIQYQLMYLKQLHTRTVQRSNSQSNTLGQVIDIILFVKNVMQINLNKLMNYNGQVILRDEVSFSLKFATTKISSCVATYIFIHTYTVQTYYHDIDYVQTDMPSISLLFGILKYNLFLSSLKPSHIL